VAGQLVKNKAEAGDILEIALISGQQPAGMLHGLAGEPQVLNAVTMLPAGGLDLGGKGAEDTPGCAIDIQKRLAFEAPEGGQPLLADSWVSSNFRAGPGRRRATCWRFLSMTIPSPSTANRSNTRRRLRAR